MAPKSERPAGRELDEQELKKVSGGYQTGGTGSSRRLGGGSV